MTEYTLCHPTEATPLLAATIGGSRVLRLEVSEDKCFPLLPWLHVGRIELYPSPINDTGQDDLITTAIRLGQFSWTLPSSDQLLAGLKASIGEIPTDAISKAEKVLREALQDITRRLLLLLPTLDAGILSEMPFRTPTTLVVDTSAVKQGALDFACRFLYPMARIKVPAVVPVEILNMADRFLAQRRRPKTTIQYKINCLAEHIESQGTQRALLRLEWHSEVEVERPTSGPDPLRAIFKPDAEIKEDSLSVVQRSLADRLIFESAREHKSQLSPEHKVCVVTSDQGLARMVLAEGMVPIYFDARKTANPIGKKLTGTLFHPFTAQMYTVSLTAVLWELATCFGSVRLVHENGEFQVTAMTDDLPWFPYQSRENLLWCRSTVPPSSLSTSAVAMPFQLEVEPIPIIATTVSDPDQAEQDEAKPSETLVPLSLTTEQGERIRTFVISTPTLLRLINQLSINGSLSATAAGELLGITSVKEYDRFLKSGGFITKNGEDLTKTSRLDELATAIKTLNTTDITILLGYIPSFRAYVELLTKHQNQPDWNPALCMRRSTSHAYKVLAEVSTLAITIPEKGIYVTDTRPTVEEFSDAALASYQDLSHGDQWVLTGEWLEELSCRYRYHPLISRQMLQSAYDNGFVDRYFEGSTIETRFENHKLAVLEKDEDGTAIIRDYRLYHGDFLQGGRASVRIQLERKRQ